MLLLFSRSDVEDVVDDIFGKDNNDNEEGGDDQAEVAAELADLQDEGEAQPEEEEEEDIEGQTFDAEEGVVRRERPPPRQYVSENCSRSIST